LYIVQTGIGIGIGIVAADSIGYRAPAWYRSNPNKMKKIKKRETYNVIRFREQKSFKFLIESRSAAGCPDLRWKAVPSCEASNTERPLTELH